MRFMGYLITIIVILVLVFIYLKKEEDEQYLPLKVIGYYLLGSFKFSFNQFPIPLGYLIYFFGMKPAKNIKVKKMVATFGLIMFCYGVIMPNIENTIYTRQLKVPISSSNIRTIDFEKDIEAIRDKYKLKDELLVQEFSLKHDGKGEITSLYLVLQSHRPEDNNVIHYNINYYGEGYNNEKLMVNRYKVENNINKSNLITTTEFFNKIDVILDKGLNNEYKLYTLDFSGISSILPSENLKVAVIDSDNNIREVTTEDATLSGIIMSYWGYVIDSETDSSYSARGDEQTAINYVIKY